MKISRLLSLCFITLALCSCINIRKYSNSSSTADLLERHGTSIIKTEMYAPNLVSYDDIIFFIHNSGNNSYLCISNNSYYKFFRYCSKIDRPVRYDLRTRDWIKVDFSLENEMLVKLKGRVYGHKNYYLYNGLGYYRDMEISLHADDYNRFMTIQNDMFL